MDTEYIILNSTYFCFSTLEGTDTTFEITGLTEKTLYDIELQIVCENTRCSSKNVDPSKLQQYTSSLMPFKLKILEYYNKAVKIYWQYTEEDPTTGDEFIAINLATSRYF